MRRHLLHNARIHRTLGPRQIQPFHRTHQAQELGETAGRGNPVKIRTILTVRRGLRHARLLLLIHPILFQEPQEIWFLLICEELGLPVEHVADFLRRRLRGQAFQRRLREEREILNQIADQHAVRQRIVKQFIDETRIDRRIPVFGRSQIEPVRHTAGGRSEKRVITAVARRSERNVLGCRSPRCSGFRGCARLAGLTGLSNVRHDCRSRTMIRLSR